MTDLGLVPNWSASAIELFENCPWWFHEERVSKRFKREWSGPEAEYGKDVHKRLEQRLKNGRPLPDELSNLEPYCAELEGMGGDLHAEYQMAINRQMKPVEWFAKDAWGRAAADVLVVSGDTAVIVDWKTGKPKFPELQSHILAYMTFLHFPHLRHIRSRFIYTKFVEEKGDTYDMHKDAQWLAKEIAGRIRDIAFAYKNKSWPKNPTGLCGWCPVKSCEHQR